MFAQFTFHINSAAFGALKSQTPTLTGRHCSILNNGVTQRTWVIASDCCLVDRNAFTDIVECSQAHYVLWWRTCAYQTIIRIYRTHYIVYITVCPITYTKLYWLLETDRSSASALNVAQDAASASFGFGRIRVPCGRMYTTECIRRWMYTKMQRNCCSWRTTSVSLDFVIDTWQPLCSTVSYTHLTLPTKRIV